MPVAVPQPTYRVRIDDPVIQRLAVLMTRLAEDDPRREKIGTTRSFLMRQARHTWRVCPNCDLPFDAVADLSSQLCPRCKAAA